MQEEKKSQFYFVAAANENTENCTTAAPCKC